MAWPDALRRSRPILTSANSAPGGSSFTHTMDRRAIRPHNRHVPTLSFDDAFAEVKAKVDLVKVVQDYVRLQNPDKYLARVRADAQERSDGVEVDAQQPALDCCCSEVMTGVSTGRELR